MEGVSVIPESAWVQAVFVCLFIFMVIGLLYWFSKREKSWQDFMSNQNDKWQKSADKQNNQWQHWLEEQNARECAHMDKVTAALDKLSTKIDDHDGKVESRINDAVSSVRRTTKTKKE